MISICQNCGMRVIAQSDGTCPSCGKLMAVSEGAAAPPIEPAEQIRQVEPAIEIPFEPTQFDSAHIDSAHSADGLRYEVLQNFESMWRHQVPLLTDVVAALPGDLTPETRRALLVELVNCDLEYRWGVASASRGKGVPKPSKLTLADYVRQFPELTSSGAPPVRLRIAEFRMRRTANQKVDLDEYLGPAANDRDGDARSLVNELLKTTPTRPSACPNIWLAIGACLVVVLLQAVALAFLGRGNRTVAIMSGASLSLLICHMVILLMGHVILTSAHQEDRHRVVATRWPCALHLLLILLLVLPCWGCTTLLGNALSKLVMLQQATPAIPMSVGWSSIAYVGLAREPWIVIIVVGCLIPAVSEELFFRAVLGRGLVRTYGATAGVLMTSSLFALYHTFPVHTLEAGLFGIVAHCVYLTTKSFAAPVLLHALYNLWSLSLLRFHEQGSFNVLRDDGCYYISPTLFLSSFSLVAVLLWLLHMTRIRWFIIDQLQWQPGFVSAESPPAAIPASARPAKASGSMVGLSLFSFLFFGAALWGNAVGWIAIDHGNQAMVAADSGDLKLAERLSERALKSRPQFAWLYVCRAWVAIRAEADKAALADCDKAIELDKNLAQAYITRAFLQQREGSLDLAMKDCDTALRIDPNSASALATRAGVWLEKGEPQKALLDAGNAYKLAPRDEQTLIYRGRALTELSEYKMALENFNQAINLNPKCLQAYYLRSRVFEQQEKWDDAMADITKCIELDGEQDDLLQARVKLWIKMEQHEKALPDLEILLERHPEDDAILQLYEEANPT